MLSAESPPRAVLDAHVPERHVFAGREKDWWSVLFYPQYPEELASLVLCSSVWVKPNLLLCKCKDNLESIFVRFLDKSSVAGKSQLYPERAETPLGARNPSFSLGTEF